MLNNYQRRKFRVRNKIIKSNKSNSPRIVVNRSNKNTYAQLIDHKGNVLYSFSTLLIKDKKAKGIELAKITGREFAKLCVQGGIKKVIFDKGAYAYNGKVKALAESCRENGLQF